MIGWLDCSSGISGDMLLGALVGAGADLGDLQAAVDRVAPEPVRLRSEPVRRAGLAATRVHVEAAASTTRRTWPDLAALLATSRARDVAGIDRAVEVFRRLAEAEAAVHGTTPDEVHFHEVGALDAIADVVATCAGFALLGIEQVHASAVALGGGSVRTEHGTLPVPVPAVVELLRGAPVHGGPVQSELTTPSGAAVLASIVTAWGPAPAMTLCGHGVGAGARDHPGRPNVLRLLLGEPHDLTGPQHGAVVLETNVDDQDPRLWPEVIAALLAAGASDAWLTPILMKKGRPAHTLHVLGPAESAQRLREVVLSHTTAIGLREHRVAKHELVRAMRSVGVQGHAIRVKVASDSNGRVLNIQPEWADVAAAATALSVPAKTVLATALSLAQSESWIPA